MWEVQRRTPVSYNSRLTCFYLYFFVNEAFVVRYEVTAKIIHTDKDIGPLIDRIGKHRGAMIMSVDWKDAEEEDEEMITIDMGLE